MGDVLPFPKPDAYEFYRLDDDSLSSPDSSLRKGDICKIHLGEVCPGDIHAVRTRDGKLCLKYIRLDGDQVELRGAGRSRPFLLPAGFVEIIGRAVEFYDPTGETVIEAHPLLKNLA